MPPRARSRSAREESPNRKPFSAAPSPRTKYSFPVVNTPVLRRSRHNSENQPPDIVANVKANSPFSDASVSPALHSSKSASTKGKHHGSLSLPPRPPPPRPSPSTNLGRTGHDSQGHAKRKLNLDSTQCVDAPADSHLPCDQSKDDEHEKCTDQDNGVKVVVRVRPCNQKEEAEDATQIAEKISDETINLIDQTFTFDHVAGQDASQKAMFEMVGKPLVENCLEGFNSSIFAYGQTGSGKTYTMWGAIQDLMAQPPSEGRGLTPRVFEFLFERIKEEENKNADKQLRYQCRCSFFEIYNEQITDLLEPLQKSLQVREDTKTGVYVENLTEEFVSCPSEVFHLMTKGLGNRKIASTGMNIESSRSHTLFTCIIESRCKSMSDGISSVRTSRMNLVDLAGSERQKLTGAGGDRLREAGNINRSLSQLGNVINILAEVSQSGKPRHIPYRDSRLTFLLQESLGGNAKLAIICAISPASSCKNETLSTLRFAQRAKAIQNKAIVNEETEDDVKILREQIRQLKDELMRMKSNETMSGGAGCYSTSWNARRSYNLLRMSLSRPLTLPHTDTDSDEEMEIDEDAVEGSNDLSFLSTQAQSLVRALEIKEIKNGSCVSDTETLSNLCDGVAQALSASDSISTGDPAVSACSLDLHENFDIKDNVVNGEEKIVNNEELPEQGNFKLTWNSAQVNGENVEVTGFERRNLDEPLSSGGPGVLIDKELPEHEIPQLSQNHKEGKIGDEVTNFDKKNNVVDGEQNIVNNEELPEQGNIKLSWNSAQVNDENVEGTGFERRNFDEPHISGCPGILIHKELPEHEIPQLSQNHTDGKIGDEEVTGFQTSNGADVYMSEASFELAPNEFSKSLLANASLSINAPLNNIEVTCKRETKSVMFEDPDAHGVSVSNNSQTIKSGLTVQDDVPLLKECIKVDEDVVNLEPVCGIFEEPDSDIGPVSSNVPSSSFMPRMEDGDVCELSESPLNKESESEANVKGYFSVDTEAELTTESDKGTDKLPASACTPNEFEFDEASISTDAHCNEHQPAYIAHLDTVQVQTDVKDSCCTAVHSSGNSLRDPDADIVQHLFNKTECMTATNLDTTVINDGEQICESPEAHAQKNPDASRDQQHFSKIECLATKMPDVTVINNGEQICESAEIHDQEGLDQLTSDLKCTVIIDDVEDHHNLESPIVNPALNLSTVDLDGSVHNAECLTTETSDNMELDRGELDKETCTSTCANAEVHTLKLPVLSLSPRLPVIDLDAPILSMSPTLGDTTQGLHRSVSPPFIGVATADACQASNEKFEDAEEGIQFNGINDTVLRTSFIKMNSRATGNPSSSAQRLAASLHRGLQIIECHQKKANSSRMSTLRFSFQKSDWDKPNSRNMVNQSVQTSLTWLPDQAVEHRDVGSNASPVEQLLGECKPEHDEEELSTPQKRINLQTKTEMEALLSGALRRERAMEDDLQRKTAEIEQLNRLV
ncbi:hypothetical protein KP509_22G048200 [Ceratopteris richardii]|uniref:Kinesin motor domain-containing protein n=1 Tax=Ceratopteris richardii TaxID=49495 RepID=A0A8T2S4U9_CERRI|nr:hypothetical protein KP509_22G048200 [Ceratopteris richardii]